MGSPLQNSSVFSPEDYEKHVESFILRSGIELSDFKVSHRDNLEGEDGEYEIDVTTRFSALESSFLVLVECKHHKNPIKRDVVQVLKAKLDSVGAQKGMVFTTSSFQSGAISYAQKHGIALVKLTDADFKVYNSAERPPREERDVVGAYLVGEGSEGNTRYSPIGLFEPYSIFRSLNAITDDEYDRAQESGLGIISLDLPDIAPNNQKG